MGCWFETCGFSNLPIEEGTPIRAMAIKQVEKVRSGGVIRPFDLFIPVTFLARGEYNDYGGIVCYPGERERFLKSAELTGTPTEYTLQDHDDPETLPGDIEMGKTVHLWMIREDTFQMILGLPYSYGWREGKAKTIGAAIEWRKQLVRECVERARTDRDEEYGFVNYAVVEDFNSAFGRGETPMWNLRHAAVPRLEQAKNDEEAFIAACDPMFDLVTIFMGMEALRKTMVTTGGGGSQDWNSKAYKMLADHTKKVSIAWEKKYD